MKKFIALLSVLLLAGLMVSAQNPFLKDQNDVYLKVETDKVGIGGPVAADKVSIYSVTGETPLGLFGYPNHFNPYITLYNSNGVKIWRLFANQNWFTIGSTKDTSNALIVGKILKSWLKFNATLSVRKLISPIGEFTATTASTATVTTFYSTTAKVTDMEVTDTTGIVLSRSDGTRYRIFVTASGSISIAEIP